MSEAKNTFSRNIFSYWEFKRNTISVDKMLKLTEDEVEEMVHSQGDKTGNKKTKYHTQRIIKH